MYYTHHISAPTTIAVSHNIRNVTTADQFTIKLTRKETSQWDLLILTIIVVVLEQNRARMYLARNHYKAKGVIRNDFQAH